MLKRGVNFLALYRLSTASGKGGLRGSGKDQADKRRAHCNSLSRPGWDSTYLPFPNYDTQKKLTAPVRSPAVVLILRGD